MLSLVWESEELLEEDVEEDVLSAEGLEVVLLFLLLFLQEMNRVHAIMTTRNSAIIFFIMRNSFLKNIVLCFVKQRILKNENSQNNHFY